jgi:uncharacterized protein (TIGR03437 family)
MLKTLAFAVLLILALAGVASAQQLVSPTSLTFAAQQGSTSVQSGGFVASPSSLTFRGTAGGANPEAQTFSLTSYTALILQVYYAAATTSSGGNWLSVAPASGFTPHTLTVTVNAQGLALGTYFGQISVTAPNVAPATVQVTLTVDGTGGSTLTANPSSLSFSAAAGGALQTSQVYLSATTFGTYTASSNQSWLNIGYQGSMSASVSAPGYMTVYANPASLSEGTYSGAITIYGASGNLTLYTTLVVGHGVGPPGGLTVSPATLALSAAVGGQSTIQTVSVYATTPTYYYATVQSGSSWLILNQSSGTTPSSITLYANAAGLTAGTYYGYVGVTSSLGSQTVAVALFVGPEQTGGFAVSPSSLTFRGTTGGANPEAQTFNLTRNTPLLIQAFYAAATTLSGGQWLTVTPTSGFSVTPSALTVTVNTTGLVAGNYAGRIDITGPRASPATVQVTLTVSLAPMIAVNPPLLSFSYQSGGTAPPPQSLRVSSTGGPANLTVAASTTTGGGWLSIGPLSGTTPASLSVSVSPGALPPGEYAGTVTVASATAGNSPQTVSVRLVISSVSLPVITTVVNAASALPTAAAPGLIVSILGANLGSTQGVSGRVVGGVLETTVAETRVLFDSNSAPLLYVRADQINAIVPYAVAGKFSTQLQIEHRGTRSSALMLQVVDAAPGIFAMNNQGTGQGAILNQDYSPNGLASAAARDSVVMIYATGEGQTSPGGVDGRLAVSAPYPAPVLPVKVTIGGRDTEVRYAGAAPGLVAGSMQINVRIPVDAPTGDEVPVFLSVGNRNSQTTATLVIR